MEYLIDTKGISGVIKKEPDDFIVEEVIPNKINTIDYTLKDRFNSFTSKFKEPLEQTHFTLIKRNYNTFRAINVLASKLHTSRKRFGVGGNKDKIAVTSQRVSAWKIPIKDLTKIKITDIKLKDFEYSDKRIQIGDLIGNRFTIKIQGTNDIDTIKEFIDKSGKGIPNYFGPQRFGEKRPINHKVGEELIAGRFEKAVKIILTEPGDEGEDAKIARTFLRENWGEFSEAIKNYPDRLGIEKAVLNSLIQEKNYKRAFLSIPLQVRKIFVHAYQSHLFNRKLNNMVRNRLISYDILLSPVKVSGIRELNCPGTTRKTLFFPKDFYVVDSGKDFVTIRFTLDKGCYASVLLKELMKN